MSRRRHLATLSYGYPDDGTRGVDRPGHDRPAAHRPANQTDLAGFATQYHLGAAASPLWRWRRRVHAHADRTLAPSRAPIADLRVNGIADVHLWARGVDTARRWPHGRPWRAGPGTRSSTSSKCTTTPSAAGGSSMPRRDRSHPPGWSGMLIVQLANFVTATSGGIHTVLDELGRGYQRHGHRRAVIVPAARASLELRAEGTRWIELPGRAVRASGGYRVLTDRALVAATLDDLRPDAIEIHDRFTLGWVARWARERGIPSTTLVHERLATSLRTFGHLGPLAGPIERHLNRRLLAATDEVVVASAYSAAGFRGDPRARIIPLGVDHDRFRPERRARPLHAGGPLRLISVGRLSAEKNPTLALDVSAELRRRGVDHRLDLVGDGPMRQRLAYRARGLPVRLLGHRSPDEVAGRLADADLALVSCTREAFGLAALEALACGTAIVAPTTGAVPELLGIHDQTPSVTAAGATAFPAAAEVADALLALAGIDPAIRRAAAVRRAASYRWEDPVNRMLLRHRAQPPLAVAR